MLLASGHEVRVYSFTTDAEPYFPPHNEEVFGCLAGVGRFWRLDIKPGSPIGRNFDTQSIDLHAPWVGYALDRYFIDTSTHWAMARNLRTGALTRCEVSGDFQWATGALPELRVKPNGVVAFTAEEADLPHPAFGFGREVGFCDDDGLTVLDQGMEIEPHSLSLHGSRLTWSSGGEPRSALLP
ncbi:MAG TPA: hypothetical protein VFJ57_10560 [Solirubrobacterales bacterium]|nr:hypothetical protein [Solirubrobacterales bacterium]